jgi:hypothetical protein
MKSKLIFLFTLVLLFALALSASPTWAQITATGGDERQIARRAYQNSHTAEFAGQADSRRRTRQESQNAFVAPTLILDSSLNQNTLDIPWWWDRVDPIYLELGQPANNNPTLTVYGTASECSATYDRINIYNLATNPQIHDIGFNVYWYGLTHELSHFYQFNLGGHDIKLEEGFADAKARIIGRKLFAQNNVQSPFPPTALYMLDVFRQLPRLMLGGSDWVVRNVVRYHSEAGPLEMLFDKSGKTFKQLDLAYKNSQIPHTTQEPEAYMDVRIKQAQSFDSAASKINGKLPSTLIMSTTTSFEKGGNTEKVLGCYAVTSTASDIGWSPINPDYFLARYFSRQNGRDVPIGGILHTTITDSYGNKIAESDLTIPNSAIGRGLNFDTSKLYNGAYKFTVSIGELSEMSYFIIYNGQWQKDKLFVIANGPKYDVLDANRQPVIVVDPPGLLPTEIYPGLLVIDVANYRDDIKVSDQETTKTYSSNSELSLIWHFTERNQPFLYTPGEHFDDSFILAPGSTVALGSIAEFRGWGLTHNDPQSFEPGHEPETLDNGQTFLLLTDSTGREFKCPITYWSQWKVQVQIPLSAYPGKAAVKVILLGDTSNTISTTVQLP